MSLWAEPAARRAPFASARGGDAHLDAVERVKDWTARRFGLGDEDTILVSESARRLPGFPPMETLVAFWTADGTRHHFKAFKPVENVNESDIPPAWLRASLANNGFDCDCC